jgi:hypothetical protein
LSLKNLQTKYDALEIEYAKSIKTIKHLEGKAEFVQKKSKVQESKETQTYCEDILICCNECLFTATCEEELNYHMWMEHDDPEESKFEKDFFCKICRKSCKTVGNLKAHMNKNHTNKVQVCGYFLKGKCTFTDDDCWFDHKYDNLDTDVQNSEIECKFCVEKFKSMKYVMEHTKIEHPTTIAECKNHKIGCCRFENDTCWFKHSGNGHEEQTFNKQHPEMIEKLFVLMEKMTKRIEFLENLNK